MTPPAMQRAAKYIIQGAAYDNNLLCIGEKEVFVLDTRRRPAHGRAGEGTARSALTRLSSTG